MSISKFGQRLKLNSLDVDNFRQRLKLNSLDVEAVGDGKLNEGLLLACVANFEGATAHRRREGERALQPVVHSALACAALSASEETGRKFIVEADPRIFYKEENRLEDEALYAEVTGGMINEDERLKFNGLNVCITMHY